MAMAARAPSPGKGRTYVWQRLRDTGIDYNMILRERRLWLLSQDLAQSETLLCEWFALVQELDAIVRENLGVDQFGTKMMTKEEEMRGRQRSRSFAHGNPTGPSAGTEEVRKPRSNSFLEFLLAAEGGKLGAEGVGARPTGGGAADTSGGAAASGATHASAHGNGTSAVDVAANGATNGRADAPRSPVRVRLRVSKPKSPTKSTSPDGGHVTDTHGQAEHADHGQPLVRSDAISPEAHPHDGQHLTRSDAMSPGGTNVVVIKKKRRPKSPNKALKKMFKSAGERRGSDGTITLDPMSPTRSPMSPDNFGLSSPLSPESSSSPAPSPARGSVTSPSPVKTWL